LKGEDGGAGLLVMGGKKKDKGSFLAAGKRRETSIAIHKKPRRTAGSHRSFHQEKEKGEI